jgi:hypothetical protein
MKRDKGKTGVGGARGAWRVIPAARGGAYDGPAVPSLVRLAKISFFFLLLVSFITFAF